MNAATQPLVIEMKDNVNTTFHINTLRRERRLSTKSTGCQPYCICGHKPSIIPVKKTVDGKRVERFVALCTTCGPAGAAELKEFKAPYLALQDFEDNSRVTIANNKGENWYAC